MSFFRMSLLAAMVAGLADGCLRADPIPGPVPSAAASSATVVPTYLLGDSTERVAATPVIWRPYWRGYSHGSAGYAPRPNLVYGPVVYPRFFRPRVCAAPQPTYVYSAPAIAAVPCSGGTSVASTAPAIAGPQVASRPQSPATGQRNPFPNEIGQSILVPESYVPPPSTEEPPLANAVDVNRVKTPATAKADGYLAYGESGAARPSGAVAINRR